MFVRFVLSVRDGLGHEHRGIFRAEAPIRRVDPRLRDLHAWFNRHLPVPGRQAFRVERNRCWFKSTASEHLARARELLALYREGGCRGLEIWNRDPGIITYEDEAQIVARPRPLG